MLRWSPVKLQTASQTRTQPLLLAACLLPGVAETVNGTVRQRRRADQDPGTPHRVARQSPARPPAAGFRGLRGLRGLWFVVCGASQTSAHFAGPVTSTD